MNILGNLLGNLPLLLGSMEGTGGAAQGGTSGILTMLLPVGLIILVFYFLIIRPQSKKQKETKSDKKTSSAKTKSSLNSTEQKRVKREDKK